MPVLSRAQLEKMQPYDALLQCCAQLPAPQTLTALHGRVGLVRHDKIITSPNATWVPDIQWQTCRVGLHEDMRFGRDDYILFPQWYHHTYPYLAAIPKQPGRGETSPYAIMWYTAQPSDFTVTAGCADDKRPGYIHKRFEAELQGLRVSLLAEVAQVDAELRQAQDATTTAGFLSSAARCMRHAWMYLTTYAGAYEEKRLELAEFQRAWLELKGLVNYYTWHRDRCNSLNDPVPREAERCVGCIVSNPPLAMMFHDMGVPVWLVREKFAVLMGDIYIGFPTDLAIKLGDHGEDVSLVRDPTFPEIFTQSPQHPLHYHVQHRFSRVRSVVIRSTPAGTLSYKDIPVSAMSHRDAGSMLVSLQALRAQNSAGADAAAASSSTSVSSTTSISSAASSSSRPQKGSKNSTRVHPYPASSNPKSQAAATAPANRKTSNLFAPDMLVEADGPDQPHVIPAWRYAISRIDTLRHDKAKPPPPHHYAFPQPKIFATDNASRGHGMFTSWLHIRHFWIAQVRLRVPSKSVIALKGQVWRDILRVGLGGPEPKSPSAGNAEKIRRELEKSGLKASADCTSITFDSGEMLRAEDSRITGPARRDVVFWQDSKYDFGAEGVPAYVKRQVMWELHELNFRFDLLSLDDCLADESPDVEHLIKRQEHFMLCWGASSRDFYEPTDALLPSRNRGLADDHIDTRLRYVRYLRDICATWPSFPMPAGMHELQYGVDSRKAEDLEVKLYSALQQTFFDLFARPMIAPRRLFGSSQ